MDRHDDEPNRPFAQLCERAYKTSPQYANLSDAFWTFEGKTPSFIKKQVFWDVMLCLQVSVSDVSEEHNAFNLRIQSNKRLLLKPADSTDKQRNKLQYARTQKTKII
jgi:hypothetical protein